jgi:hypothetical protein
MEPVTLGVIGLALWALLRGGKKRVKNGPYVAPKPNLPSGPQTPVRKIPKTRPRTIDPTELWVGPTTCETMEGDDWILETAQPAIDAWVAAGFGNPAVDLNDLEDVRKGTDRVVREVIFPYAPTCVPDVPWLDVYVEKFPFPKAADFPSQPGNLLKAQEVWEQDRQKAITEHEARVPEFKALLDRLADRVFDTHSGGG